VAETIIRVTVEDIQLGDTQVAELIAGQYMVLCAEPMYLAGSQHHLNGTVQLTLKRRARHG
jgi:hypothetical protein